jgi:hypothetical protein
VVRRRLVTLATAARADERADALRLRRAGRVRTGVEGPCAHGETTGNDAATGLFFAGIAISVVGDALWIAGATLWSAGARRVRRASAAGAP